MLEIIIAGVLFGLSYNHILTADGGLLENFPPFMVKVFGSKRDNSFRENNKFTSLFSCSVCMAGQLVLWISVASWFVDVSLFCNVLITIFTTIILVHLILKIWK